MGLFVAAPCSSVTAKVTTMLMVARPGERGPATEIDDGWMPLFRYPSFRRGHWNPVGECARV